MPRCALLVSLIVLWVVMQADTVVARPNYKLGFEQAFQDFGEVTCAACHEGDDQRQRNEYAKQLEVALGAKMVRDQAQVVAALKKIGPPKARPVAAPVVQARAAVVMRRLAPAFVVEQAVELDDDGNAINVQVQRFSITHQNLDQWIFGSNKTVEQARTEFESQLKMAVETVTKQYELDATQRRKLQLAGRGDIKRFLGEADALHAELGEAAASTLITLDQQEYVQIQQRAIGLRNRFLMANRLSDGVTIGLFGEQSLLNKTIPKAISPKFAEKYLADQKLQRDQQYETYVTQSVQNLTQFLTLREDQKDKLKALIRSDIAPLRQLNQQAYVYVMYQLSRMPDDRLKQVLDETQLGKLGQIRANAAAYEQHLRNSGLWPGEVDEDGQEASP